MLFYIAFAFTVLLLLHLEGPRCQSTGFWADLSTQAELPDPARVNPDDEHHGRSRTKGSKRFEEGGNFSHSSWFKESKAGFVCAGTDDSACPAPKPVDWQRGPTRSSRRRSRTGQRQAKGEQQKQYENKHWLCKKSISFQIFLSACLIICLFVCLFIHPFTHLFINVLIYLWQFSATSPHLFTYSFTELFFFSWRSCDSIDFPMICKPAATSTLCVWIHFQWSHCISALTLFSHYWTLYWILRCTASSSADSYQAQKP